MVSPVAGPLAETFVGFRRRFRVCPGLYSVTAEVEDDIHHMKVRIEHDGERATRVDAEQPRAPWTTCPGAIRKLSDTFAGLVLGQFETESRAVKKQNCTHLYDLAVLAAAHAFDSETLLYDIYVCDPVDGIRKAEIWSKGKQLLAWSLADMELVDPTELGGKKLFELNEWINSLTGKDEQEIARILRWASLIANGRIIPFEEQSDALKMPPNCYTFQPEMAAEAKRVGRIRDFSYGKGEPLDGR